jgi:putative nucleotidyltransferase with HDIG domain
MPAISKLEPALEAQCRRIAALSMAIQHLAGSAATHEVVELAEALDAHFGWEPFGSSPHESAGELDDEPELFARAALQCIRVAGPEDLHRAIERLPVFPLAAQRALAVILQENWNAREMESLAGSDQALAAHLLRAANSWAHGPLRQIESIQHAITYLGADRTSRILYAASVQPMFSSPGLRDLWHHSVASAEVAQSLAEVSGVVDPKKAFLAGLVHDVGALAMAGLTPTFQTLFRQLTNLGCEPIVAERVLAGMSHAEVGARALGAWKFAAEFSDAIRFHHSPERTENRLAALLYLTEQWTDSSEDLPSAARFRFAMQAVGLTLQQFEELTPAMDRMLGSLR